MASMLTGLEVLLSNPHTGEGWGRCGLVCNQASVTRDFKPAWTVLRELLGKRLVALFGPQHGFYGTAQDNMIETAHEKRGEFDLPVFSLYSETREPTAEMLESVDTIIIDLQITGCRIYTWKATIAACMRAAVKYGKRVVVLDRPNPVGGEILEGRVLERDATSFVGEFPVPMRHGLTAGEAARFFNKSIKAELEVVKLEGWNPGAMWSDLHRPWVLTSPNLPTIDPVYVYPGLVILEGTNISEGRGTGLPFQFCGAPYIRKHGILAAKIRELMGLSGRSDPPGLHLRDAAFEPTSGKWARQTCRGVQVHVTNPNAVRSFDLAVTLVRACIELGEGQFAWKDPPYEYDLVTLPMKLIIGSQVADQKFMATSFSIADPWWHEGITGYKDAASSSLLYKRKTW